MLPPDPGAVTVSKTDVETLASRPGQPGIRIANDQCWYRHLSFFLISSRLYEAFASVYHYLHQWALWVLVMSSELQGAPFTWAFKMTVSQLIRNYTCWGRISQHILMQSVQHFLPPCYQDFIFFFRSKRVTCTSHRQLPTDANLIFFFLLRGRLFFLTLFFLSLRGYDNMSHIVFINITCFLDLAAVSARQHTGKKHFSLAQHWFSLCWFPEQEKCIPAQL